MIREQANRAFRQGRFNDVLGLLANVAPRDHQDHLLRLEALYHCGFGQRAADEATATLRENVAPSIRSRCLSIIAAQLWDDGDHANALASSKEALSVAAQAEQPELITRAAAQLLERTCDTALFDTTLPLALQVRQSTVRCGDAQLTAYVHLTFGRLEARAERHDVARRHFQLARRLTEAEPNLFLLAAADLGEGVVLGTLGDLSGAHDLFAHGASLATECGWSKGRVAAAANLAYLLVSLGRPAEADVQLKTAVSEPFETKILGLAIADTRATASLIRGNYPEGEAILRAAESRRPKPLWYKS